MALQEAIGGGGDGGGAVIDFDGDRTVDAWVRAVATVGVDGAGAAALPALADPSWGALLRAVRRHRLGGLLAAGMASGALDLPPERREQVRRAHAPAVAWQLALEGHVVEVARVLEGAGARFRLLKGIALADRYPDRSWRQFADVDVLVAPESYEAAHAALRACGADRRGTSLGPAFDRRYGKSITHRMPGGYEVDAHRMLVIGAFGLSVDVPSLFDSAGSVDVRGTAVPTLGDAHLALHAAYTAVLSTPFRLQSLRDLVQVLHTVDPEAVVDAALRWRAGVVLRTAVLAVRAELGPYLPGTITDWADRYRPSRREQRWLRPYLPDGGGTRAQALAGWRALDSAPRRLDYLRLVALGAWRHRAVHQFDG